MQCTKIQFAILSAQLLSFRVKEKTNKVFSESLYAVIFTNKKIVIVLNDFLRRFHK